jgi:hypothetical protein
VVLKQRLYVQVLLTPACLMVFRLGKELQNSLVVLFAFCFSVLFPLLKPNDVCDQVVEAIRKDEHMLLIPKILRLGLLLKRFERRNCSFYNYSLLLVCHRQQLRSKHRVQLVFINP